MRQLIDKLNYYTKLYDEGRSTISDAEWDRMYFELQNKEKETGIIYPDSPTQSISYEVVNKLQKVEHNHKMLSLAKTKDKHEVESFLGDKRYVTMAKMDGLTCSLRYIDGKLVSAETRGNGAVGEDVTHNAMVVSSIPKEVPYKEELIVDGEIVCLIPTFEQFFAKDYKNPRNFAAGSIRLLDASECANRKLDFIAWDVVKGCDDLIYFSYRLAWLSRLGFKVVPWVQENITYAIGDIQDWCQEQGYPIDGLVFKFDDVAYGKSLGETSHHARNAIAFKFYDDVYDTKLLNIEWGMGKSGILTPVAVFEPVEIDGSVVERANLHNVSMIGEILGKQPHSYQPIRIIKSNMIIPQVVEADEKGYVPSGMANAVFVPPHTCPVCGGQTELRTSDTNTLELYCTNPECEGKLSTRIDHYLGKRGLDTKGISRATLDKLIDWGWVNSILDIYDLAKYRSEWIKKPGFGEKSVDKLLQSIEDGKNCQLDKFISAISIPLIGSASAKTLANAFGTYEAFREAVKTNYHFWDLPDFGYTTTEAIMNFDYTEADKLASILNITYDIPKVEDNGKLSGKKVCITGTLKTFKNRGELQAAIEQHGGKVVSAVTKNTHILVNNDSSSTSAKSVQAKKLNIPVLTEAEFISQYFDE